MLTMCSFILPSHLDEGLTDFVLWFVLSLVWVCLFLAPHGRAQPILLLFIKPNAKCVYKQDLRQSDKVEVDVKRSVFVLAQLHHGA